MREIILSISITLLIIHSIAAQRSDFAYVDFHKADSIASLYEGHALTDINGLALKLTSPLPSDAEKFRAIYRWVCDNIENDYGLYTENKRKREKLHDPEALNAWNEKFTPRVFQKLVRDKSTVCTGYSYLIRELALHAGLSCVAIHGYGRTAHANIGGPGIPNHSWNAVQINTKWYLCDATWSSGSIDPVSQSFVRQFDDSYLFAEPARFIRSHYPMDSSLTFESSKFTLDQFLDGPLVYRGTFQYQVDPVYPDTFSAFIKRGDTLAFEFKVANYEAVKNATIEVWLGNSKRSLPQELLRNEEGLCQLNHNFNRRGNYTVHILLNSIPVVTYTVNVTD